MTHSDTVIHNIIIHVFGRSTVDMQCYNVKKTLLKSEMLCVNPVIKMLFSGWSV